MINNYDIIFEDLFDLKLYDYQDELGTRTYNALRDRGINSFGDLFRDRRVKEIKGLGNKGYKELKKFIKENIHPALELGMWYQNIDQAIRDYNLENGIDMPRRRRKEFFNTSLKDLNLITFLNSNNNDNKPLDSLGDLLYILVDDEKKKKLNNRNAIEEKLFSLGFSNINEYMTKKDLDNLYVSDNILELTKAIIAREKVNKLAKFDEEATKKTKKIYEDINSDLDTTEIKKEIQDLKNISNSKEAKIKEIESLLSERNELLKNLKNQDEKIDNLYKELDRGKKTR